jgi:hypothetical protein
MPYEQNNITCHYEVSYMGKISRWGSRTLANPLRVEFDLLYKTQRAGKMGCVHVTVYDWETYPERAMPHSNDWVSVLGLPDPFNKIPQLMCFGKDVRIINRFIPKRKI